MGVKQPLSSPPILYNHNLHVLRVCGNETVYPLKFLPGAPWKGKFKVRKEICETRI